MPAEYVVGSGVFYEGAGLPWHFGMRGGATRAEISDRLLTIEEGLDRSAVGGQRVERVPLYHKVGDEFVEVPTHIGVRDKDSNALYGVHGADVYLSELNKERAAALAGAPLDQALRAVAANWAQQTKKLGPKRQLWHYRRSLIKLVTPPEPPEAGK